MQYIFLSLLKIFLERVGFHQRTEHRIIPAHRAAVPAVRAEAAIAGFKVNAARDRVIAALPDIALGALASDLAWDAVLSCYQKD